MYPDPHLSPATIHPPLNYHGASYWPSCSLPLQSAVYSTNQGIYEQLIFNHIPPLSKAQLWFSAALSIQSLILHISSNALRDYSPGHWPSPIWFHHLHPLDEAELAFSMSCEHTTPSLLWGLCRMFSSLNLCVAHSCTLQLSL